MSEGIEYRPILGHLGYYVGSDGTLWTEWKLRGKPGVNREAYRSGVRRRLALCVLKTGYPSARLKRDGGGCSTVCVHVAVLSAFVGPRPEGNEGRHLNGDKLDNRASNLAWGTRKENAEDMVRHGRSTRGEKSPAALMTDAQVLALRSLRSVGLSCNDISGMYGFRHQVVSRVTTRSWAHLPGAVQGRYLSPEVARKALALRGKMGPAQIASLLGISRSSVSRIHRGEERWERLELAAS